MHVIAKKHPSDTFELCGRHQDPSQVIYGFNSLGHGEKEEVFEQRALQSSSFLSPCLTPALVDLC